MSELRQTWRGERKTLPKYVNVTKIAFESKLCVVKKFSKKSHIKIHSQLANL